MDSTYLTLLIALIVAAIVVYYLFVLEKEKFSEENNSGNNAFAPDPYKITLNPHHETCLDDLDKNIHVSVAEFMTGRRFKCYNQN